MISRKMKFVTLSIFELMVLVALFSSTIAWFSANKNEQISAGTISASGEFSFILKAYKGNYKNNNINSTLQGYTSIDEGADARSLTSYGNDFVSVDEADYASALAFNKSFPGLRYTYALEINNDSSSLKNVNVALTSFYNLYDGTSTVVNNNYILDGSSVEHRIGLADAINIYSLTLDPANLTEGTTLTSLSQGFINESSANLTDKFNFSCVNETVTPTYEDGYRRNSYSYEDNPFMIAEASGIPSTTANTRIVLFTVEFSNNISTYFKFSNTVDTKNYYVKDTTDTDITVNNSNVYFDNSFKISKLRIYKDS